MQYSQTFFQLSWSIHGRVFYAGWVCSYPPIWMNARRLSGYLFPYFQLILVDVYPEINLKTRVTPRTHFSPLQNNFITVYKYYYNKQKMVWLMKQNNRIICKNGADNVAKTTNARQGAFWSYLQLSMSHQVQEKICKTYAKFMQRIDGIWYHKKRKTHQQVNSIR